MDIPKLAPLSSKRSPTATTEGSPVETFGPDGSLLGFSEKGSSLEGIPSWTSDCPMSSDLSTNRSGGLSQTQRVGDTSGSCIISTTQSALSLALTTASLTRVN